MVVLSQRKCWSTVGISTLPKPGIRELEILPAFNVSRTTFEGDPIQNVPSAISLLSELKSLGRRPI